MALAQDQGWRIEDVVRADTGSIYFSLIQPAAGDGTANQPLFLRVRISGHKAAGWQSRARYAFITAHCPRRAKRDLERLAHRMKALDEGDLRRGRASRPNARPPR